MLSSVMMSDLTDTLTVNIPSRGKKMHTSVMSYFFLLPSGLELVAIFRPRLEFHGCTIQSILDVFYMSQGTLSTTKFSLTDLVWFRKFEISTRP